MTPEQADSFLDLVGADSLVSYLTRYGDTPDSGLGERLKWAAGQGEGSPDLAEARFLITNAYAIIQDLAQSGLEQAPYADWATTGLPRERHVEPPDDDATPRMDEERSCEADLATEAGASSRDAVPLLDSVPPASPRSRSGSVPVRTAPALFGSFVLLVGLAAGVWMAFAQ